MQERHAKVYRSVLGLAKQAPLPGKLVRLHDSMMVMSANMGDDSPPAVNVPLICLMAGAEINPDETVTWTESGDNGPNPTVATTKPGTNANDTPYEIGPRGTPVLKKPEKSPSKKQVAQPVVGQGRCKFNHYGKPIDGLIEARTKRSVSVVFQHNGKEKRKKIKVDEVIEFMGNGSP